MTPLHLTDENQENAVIEILKERRRQNQKWGEQNHDMYKWLAILMEEVGELSQEVLRSDLNGKDTNNLKVEAIQVAAVALQIVEYLERKAS